MNMAKMESIAKELGLPIEKKKTEGPATQFTFLGIELDMVAMEMQLPLNKLPQLKLTLEECKEKKAFHKRNLLSLIGTLSS